MKNETQADHPAAADSDRGAGGAPPVRSSVAFSAAHGDRDADYYGVAHLLAHWGAAAYWKSRGVTGSNWYDRAHNWVFHSNPDSIGHPGAHSHPRDADAGDSADDDVELLA